MKNKKRKTKQNKTSNVVVSEQKTNNNNNNIESDNKIQLDINLNIKKLSIENKDNNNTNKNNKRVLNESLINSKKNSNDSNKSKSNTDLNELKNNKILSDNFLDMNNFSFFVHISSLVTKIVYTIVMNSWEIITDAGKFSKISIDNTLIIFKYKKFFIKNMITLFNNSWEEKDDNSIIDPNKIETLKKYGKIHHDFCCFFILFEICKNVLESTLDSINLKDINSSRDSFKSTINQLIDKKLSFIYDDVVKRNNSTCICGQKLISETSDNFLLRNSNNFGITMNMANKTRKEHFIFIKDY